MAEHDEEWGKTEECVRFSRSDLILYRRAARENWGVPDAVKNEAIFQLALLIARPDTKDKLRLAATRMLLTADRVDQLADRLALDRLKQSGSDETTAADLVREMMDAAGRYERNGEGSGPGGAGRMPEGPDPVQPDDPGPG